ncbi:hypothetical protein B6U99_03710 [Candidatus Geothermarchaeota archaeon ex4572_27]|nr:MAG: hypothetical protein B6U99_03710 [Candidatus Geothermarchaeota archaeon ex4572_27]
MQREYREYSHISFEDGRGIAVLLSDVELRVRRAVDDLRLPPTIAARVAELATIAARNGVLVKRAVNNAVKWVLEEERPEVFLHYLKPLGDRQYCRCLNIWRLHGAITRRSDVSKCLDVLRSHRFREILLEVIGCEEYVDWLVEAMRRASGAIDRVSGSFWLRLFALLLAVDRVGKGLVRPDVLSEVVGLPEARLARKAEEILARCGPEVRAAVGVAGD